MKRVKDFRVRLLLQQARRTQNVVLESDGSVTANFTIRGYSFDLKAVIYGDNIQGTSGERKISFNGSRLD